MADANSLPRVIHARRRLLSCGQEIMSENPEGGGTDALSGGPDRNIGGPGLSVACPQDSKPRSAVFSALAVRTGSQYSRSCRRPWRKKRGEGNFKAALHYCSSAGCLSGALQLKAARHFSHRQSAYCCPIDVNCPSSTL